MSKIKNKDEFKERDEIEEYLKKLVQEIADEKGFTVQLFECGEGDHVHCFVTTPPKLSVTMIKGNYWTKTV